MVLYYQWSLLLCTLARYSQADNLLKQAKESLRLGISTRQWTSDEKKNLKVRYYSLKEISLTSMDR